METYSYFYSSLSNDQLYAAYQEIRANRQTFPDEGWANEERLIQSEAQNRGMTLENSLSNKIHAVRGYIESRSHH